ncbi:hypothetical protein D3C78_1054210 [compost metagenome]
METGLRSAPALYSIEIVRLTLPRSINRLQSVRINNSLSECALGSFKVSSRNLLFNDLISTVILALLVSLVAIPNPVMDLSIVKRLESDTITI